MERSFEWLDPPPIPRLAPAHAKRAGMLPPLMQTSSKHTHSRPPRALYCNNILRKQVNPALREAAIEAYNKEFMVAEAAAAAAMGGAMAMGGAGGGGVAVAARR